MKEGVIRIGLRCGMVLEVWRWDEEGKMGIGLG